MKDYRDPLTDDQAEQVERGLRRLLNTPPKPHGKNPDEPAPKRVKRPAPKDRERKAKSRP
jgi:hypothetical protein